MRFEVLGIDYDRRIQCYMLNARVDYEWYLAKTDGAEKNLEIQRDIIKGSKSYMTLRADLKRGCILPTIVIAARNVDISALKGYDPSSGFITVLPADKLLLENSVNAIQPADVDIIDGLQRTNALRQTFEDLKEDEQKSFLERSLRLEIWMEIPFYSLAYRMLLLNAGQKPMSMKHQIDILSGGLWADLKDIDGIDLIKLKDHRRRVRPGQIHLSTVAQAFQAWLQRNPNVDLANMVVEALVVDDALESLGLDLANGTGGHRDDFRAFIQWLVQLDYILGDNFNRFLGNDTVVLGMAAAVGFAHKNEQLRERLHPALEKILQEARDNPENPIGINLFENLRKNIDTKKRNVGEATRDLAFRAVREYILQSGFSTMEECWAQAASLL